MKTIHVVVAVAAWLGVSGIVRASSAEVGYRRAEALVALAEGQPAGFLMVGELCAAPDELSDAATVQLHVHGATYNHDYWDFGSVQGTTYSYARAVAARGIATFALDEIGADGSSHPLSTLVTVEAARGSATNDPAPKDRLPCISDAVSVELKETGAPEADAKTAGRGIGRGGRATE